MRLPSTLFLAAVFAAGWALRSNVDDGGIESGEPSSVSARTLPSGPSPAERGPRPDTAVPDATLDEDAAADAPLEKDAGPEANADAGGAPSDAGTAGDANPADAPSDGEIWLDCPPGPITPLSSRASLTLASPTSWRFSPQRVPGAITLDP